MTNTKKSFQFQFKTQFEKKIYTLQVIMYLLYCNIADIMQILNNKTADGKLIITL